MISFQLNSLSQLTQAAEWVLKNTGKNKIIAFYGEMGAGKTTLIKEICVLLGCNSHVTSPTFAIINEYLTTKNESIFHFDFYRLNKINEIIDIGFEEYIDGKNYCLIEWPEMVEELLPEGTVKIFISGDVERLIEF